MVRRRDLADISDADYGQRQSEYILCRDCEQTSGGTRGDFWALGMDTVFHCAACGSDNLALVRNVVTQEVV